MITREILEVIEMIERVRQGEEEPVEERLCGEFDYSDWKEGTEAFKDWPTDKVQAALGLQPVAMHDSERPFVGA